MEENKQLYIFKIYQLMWEIPMQYSLFTSNEHILKDFIESIFTKKETMEIGEDKVVCIDPIISNDTGFLGTFAIMPKKGNLNSNARNATNYDIVPKDTAKNATDYFTYFYVDYTNGIVVYKQQSEVYGFSSCMKYYLDSKKIKMDIKIVNNK